MEKEAAPAPKKSDTIRQEFTNVCANMGSLVYQMEELKMRQALLNKQYQDAIKEETPKDSDQKVEQPV